MEKKHPDIADQVICVDFDGTLYPWGYMFAGPPPLPGAVRAVKALKDAGYKIIIFTSRLSKRWLEVEGGDRYNHMWYIEELLRRDGIPYDEITEEKIPAEHYIDDKAHRFEGNWEEITSKILRPRSSMD